MKKVVVTGASGLIGWHACVHLHAENCARQFKGLSPKYNIVPIDRTDFQCDSALSSALTDADAVLHFAGINRASDDEIAHGNPALAERLVRTCELTKSDPHVVYANSTHSYNDSVYGKSKKAAAELIQASGLECTDVIYPHIFGEAAKPYYNNVTATLIDQIISGEQVSVNPLGSVSLLHAGEAADIAINCALEGTGGSFTPDSSKLGVPELCELLVDMHDHYKNNVIPDLQSNFYLDLFNTYRFAGYPHCWPKTLLCNEDSRGVLFEAVKGGGGGQTFLSTTHPGVTRGDHFHLKKVERFLVVSGEATIRIRRVLDGKVWQFHVSGTIPQVVDMPTLCTHSIENMGSNDLLTLFWAHEMFDPDAPDTYADKVLL